MLYVYDIKCNKYDCTLNEFKMRAIEWKIASL